MDLTDLQTIQNLLAKHDQTTKKWLGQNFLISRPALDKILETADVKQSDQIIEIGPGLGVLTKELTDRSDNVTSVELDSTLLPILEKTAPKAKIIHQDALRFEVPATPYKVVANIPYNITSPLINHFLQSQNPPTSLTFLVQKEVAEKICSLSPDMTVLSLQVHLFGDAKYIETIPSACFYPAPKVDSAILHITLNPKCSRENALEILKLSKRAFLGRRKKLSNTLADMKEKLISLSLQEKRPQHLTVEDWKKLI